MVTQNNKSLTLADGNSKHWQVKSVDVFFQKKVTKLLYAAVCFVFNMRLLRNQCHMLPYL